MQLDGYAPFFTEGFRRAEIARNDKIEQGAHILKTVFNRRTGHRDAGLCLHEPERLGVFGLRIFNGLCFVDNQAVKDLFGKFFNIPLEGLIRRNMNVRFRGKPPPLSVQDCTTQRRSKGVQLMFPVRQKTRRSRDKDAAMRKALFFQFENEDDNLQRFTESHIIPQQTAETALNGRIEPLKTFFLIRPERRLQCLRHRGIRFAKERIGKRRAVRHYGISGQRPLNDLVDVGSFVLHCFEKARRVFGIDKDVAVVEFHQTAALLHQCAEFLGADDGIAEHDATVIIHQVIKAEVRLYGAGSLLSFQLEHRPRFQRPLQRLRQYNLYPKTGEERRCRP